MTEQLAHDEERTRSTLARDDKPITPHELDLIQARGARAAAAVVDMCSGGRRWLMTVPPDMDRDHDMVIGAALEDLNRLITFARTAVTAPPAGRRLILASEDLLASFGTRTEDGRRITAEWGEQRPQGWYEPTFTTHEAELTLDEAWKRASTGLPAGWRMAVQRDAEQFDVWVATAVSPAFFDGDDDDDVAEGRGDTAAAALDALAVAVVSPGSPR